MGGDGSKEVVQRRGTRRSHYVNPPPIPAAADKKLIKPIGDSQWEDVTWDGTGHLGLLTAYWKYYCVDPSEQDHANKVPENVTNSWLKSQGQPLGRFRDASEMYLTAEKSRILCLKISQALTRHFVTCGHLKNFRSDQGSIEMLGLRTQHISLEVKDTAKRLNARPNMGRRWKDVMVKDLIGGLHSLTLKLCMRAAMYQAQEMMFVIPEVAPALEPPQWGMFAQMSFFPAPQGSEVQGSNPYQTLPPASEQHGDQQFGQHIDPALGDFVNNLFASGGSGHNSNEPGAMSQGLVDSKHMPAAQTFSQAAHSV
ncbi:hypothetical protein U9M48_013790 [Paspalum notatum var. saurae]|uniref:Uncharacterized protein n=1 Tax=Paspalum notatum var. saurae TaxID=547442 RepID=A0AAQ3T1F0_PASNO